MPVYHLTIFPLAVWARKQIDKIRRSFLWKGEEVANGGHCLVNWPTVNKPKDLGGLGVLDLDKFGRALRMRWLWQKWHAENKPWAGLEIPCTEMDRLLFNASTTITIGNGKKTRFWHHAWLDGEAPRNLAPHLFELVQRKHKIVAQELANNSWISALQNKITNATQLEEFVSLWIRIKRVPLNSEIEDSITWKWTPDGIYSARSSYRAQFIGSFRSFKTELISRVGVGRIKSPVLSAMDLWRLVSTSIYFALLPRQSGARSYLGRIGLSPNRPIRQILIALVFGGRRQQRLCRRISGGISTVW